MKTKSNEAETMLIAQKTTYMLHLQEIEANIFLPNQRDTKRNQD